VSWRSVYLEECLPVFRDLQLRDHEEQAIRVLEACRAAAGWKPSWSRCPRTPA